MHALLPPAFPAALRRRWRRRGYADEHARPTRARGRRRRLQGARLHPARRRRRFVQHAGAVRRDAVCGLRRLSLGSGARARRSVAAVVHRRTRRDVRRASGSRRGAHAVRAGRPRVRRQRRHVGGADRQDRRSRRARCACRSGSSRTPIRFRSGRRRCRIGASRPASPDASPTSSPPPRRRRRCR